MIPTIIISILFGYSYLSDRKLLFSFMLIPFGIILYFTISTEIFSFGRDVPFGIYDPEMKNDYRYIQYVIISHFLASYIAFYFAEKLSFRNKIHHYSKYKEIKINRNLDWRWAILCMLPVFFILISFDPSLLIKRSVFSLSEAQGGWMRFADLFFLISSIVTPFLRSRLARALVLFSIVFFFSMLGSRSAVVFIYIYIIMEQFVIKDRNYTLHAAMILFSLYLMAILLALRPVNSGGLYAILSMINTITISDILTFSIFGLNYLINYSIVISAQLIKFADPDPSWFLYSISPLPSNFYGVSDTFDSINRFRKNIPYPGLGYSLYVLGPYLYTIFIFTSHFAIGIARKHLSTRRDFLEKTLFYAMIFLPFLFFSQYNLRTGSRIFYLMVFVYFGVSLLRRVRLSHIVMPSRYRLQ